MVAALQEELEVSRQRVKTLEDRLARVRSTPNYPRGAHARLEMLGDADQFFRRLGEHTVCGVFVYDLVTGQDVYVNPRYTELLGYTLSELEAMGREAFTQLFHPDDKDRVFAHRRLVAAQSDLVPVPIEFRFRHKDGGWVWCRSYDVAFERDPSGRMVRMIGSLIDVTDVMEAKEAQAQFARMASHDLRAPTRRIRQYVELLADELGDDLPVDAGVLLSAIDQQADRMHALVVGIRRLTGIVAPAERTEVDVHSVVDRVLEALPIELDAQIVQIERDDLPAVSAFPELVQILYASLMTNALCYGDHPLTVHFTAERVGGSLVLGVRNNGPDFPGDSTASVFVPFRRVRGRSGGAGLGLPMCKRVVDCHDGRIWIEREPGHTHVRFTLARGTA